MPVSNVSRIADRHLARLSKASRVRRLIEAGFEGAPYGELLDIQKFLAGQAKSMDPKSVAYGTYAAAGFPGGDSWPLHKALLLAYRKHLIDWMNHALVARANMGGGGSGIKKVEVGLARFVEAIPAILMGKAKATLSSYLPDTEYFIADRLNPIGNKILAVARQDATAEGILGNRQIAARHRFTVRWDDRMGQWYIPFDRNTYGAYEQLRGDGFFASRVWKRWEYPKNRLPSTIYRLYDVVEPKAVEPEGPTDTGILGDWYFKSWLPANIARFTKVFSDYARGANSSYAIIFSVSGVKVKVKFKRDIKTPADAVEELRYRYTNHHGREPWLQVMDLFIKLTKSTSPNTALMMLIDRINGLQHSNGLFMELFPGSVKSWYKKFLNAKFNSTDPETLAKFIPDRDLKNLLLEMANISDDKFRAPGWQDRPGESGLQQADPHADDDPGINWRQREYPAYKGVPTLDRDDPMVQRQLRKLREFGVDSAALTSMDPDFLPVVVRWKEQAEKFRAQGYRDPDTAGDAIMGRRNLGEQEAKFLSPVRTWAREFKSLLEQEPPLPASKPESGTYDRWFDSVDRKLKEKAKVEGDLRDAVDDYDKVLRERELEQRLEQRSMRLAMALRVADRFLKPT